MTWDNLYKPAEASSKREITSGDSMMEDIILRGLRLLANPEKAFGGLGEKTLEENLSDYLKLLLIGGVLAGIAQFLLGGGRALYFDLTTTMSIGYPLLLNYLLGRAVSILFFYLFAGTFLMFFLSIILGMFVRGVKYTTLVRILIAAAYPLLLFGWLPFTQGSLAVWSAFLFVLGVRAYRGVKHASRDSINQRD